MYLEGQEPPKKIMPVIGDELNFGTDLVRSLEAFRDSEVHWIVWEFRASREVRIQSEVGATRFNQLYIFSSSTPPSWRTFTIPRHTPDTLLRTPPRSVRTHP